MPSKTVNYFFRFRPDIHKILFITWTILSVIDWITTQLRRPVFQSDDIKFALAIWIVNPLRFLSKRVTSIEHFTCGMTKNMHDVIVKNQVIKQTFSNVTNLATTVENYGMAAEFWRNDNGKFKGKIYNTVDWITTLTTSCNPEWRHEICIILQL